ncbi:hypothetical protein B7494_g1841 [Chlorociboria aeruginascens]|nr:hypothetical protein B7494_g1841 [Chlorociboria aeruginascens]
MASQSFLAKKKHILAQLAVPAAEYDDLSPKGSIDEGIRDLIDEINGIEGCVTTSSCAGRISVFLEGKRSEVWLGDKGDQGNEEETVRISVKGAGIGGKGGGGKWLFVSHEEVDIMKNQGKRAEMLGMGRQDNQDSCPNMLGMSSELRFIHFKFEPMILHILTASLEQAQIVLSAALQAGFRESGALNLISSSAESPTPMVAVRSMGLALESIVGCHRDPTPDQEQEDEKTEICITPEVQLDSLLQISNLRFRENTIRIDRFRKLLKDLTAGGLNRDTKRKGQDGVEWEDAQSRKERKKAEGLKRSLELRNSGHKSARGPDDSRDLAFPVENT